MPHLRPELSIFEQALDSSHHTGLVIDSYHETGEPIGDHLAGPTAIGCHDRQTQSLSLHHDIRHALDA